MKKLGVFVFGFILLSVVLLSLSLVSAVDCVRDSDCSQGQKCVYNKCAPYHACANEDQIIMKLQDAINSRGALWNYGITVKGGFGGMYAADYYTSQCLYANPLSPAGGCSCPQGYTPSLVYGTPNLGPVASQHIGDNKIWLCNKTLTQNEQSMYGFGGAFGYQYDEEVVDKQVCPTKCIPIKTTDMNPLTNQLCTGLSCLSSSKCSGWINWNGKKECITNDITGDCSCPQGYTAQQIKGYNKSFSSSPLDTYRDNVKDFESYYCYKTLEAGEKNYFFGGMWSGTYADPLPDYNNPTTGLLSCPVGYKQKEISYSCNRDTPLYYCYQYDNFNYDVCYNDIFGKNYGGAAPHDCTLNEVNRVVSLADTTNSLAFKDKDTTYKYPVCYDNLKCRAVSSGNCALGEKVVLSLEKDRDSLLASGNFPDYPVKICCFSEGELIGANWKDMDNTKVITEANLNDYVKLVLSGTGIEGKSITYTIYKDVAFWFDTKIAESFTEGSAIWQVKSSAGKEVKVGDKFYFIAETEGKQQKSGNLDIVECGADPLPPCDSPFILKILAPACGADIKQGDEVEIQVQASDEDDLITGELKVDGVKISGISNGLTKVLYTFSKAGNLQIVAEGTNTRSKRKKAISNVMVYAPSLINEKYVAACIKSPENYDDIEADSAWFDASTSRAIKWDGTKVVNLTTDTDKSIITFYWKFSDGDSWSLKGEKESVYKFPHWFGKAGPDQWANLEVEIV